MSILDKASLIQIPSGYKNGKLYSVKPNPSYGSELAVNGDFTTDSDWSKGSGWSIVNGEAVHTGSGDYIEQGSLVQGTNYKVVIVVTQASGSGFPQIYMGGLTTAMTSPNTYTFDITAQSGDKIKLRGLNNCKVDSISVKEILVADGDFTFARSSSATRVNAEGLIETASVVSTTELVTNGGFDTDSDWTLGSNTTIANGALNFSSATSNTDQSLTTTNTKIYKVVFTISNYVSGSVRFRFTGTANVNGISRSTNGTFTQYITATANNSIFRFAANAFNGSIDNVSVKEVIENDVPRLDYSDGSCASLLLEPQRTNLVTHSSDFSDSSWFKLGLGTASTAVVTTDYATSPEGLNNATRLQVDLNGGTTSSDQSLIYDALAVSSGDNTRSIYVKSNDSNNYDVYFGGTLSSYEIKQVTSEWTRIDATRNFSSSGTGYLSIGLRGGTGCSDNADILIYGAQVEAGSYSTSLINTDGSTVTRTADVCNNAGTSETFNSTEGVLFAEIAALEETSSSSKYISISDETYNNRLSILFSSGATNRIRAFLRVGGASQVDFNANVTDVTDYNKVAFKYKSNDFALWVNGVEVATDTSGSVFGVDTLTKLSFSEINTTSNKFEGKTKQLMTFNEALSDEELSDLTGQVNLSFNNLANFYNYIIL